MLGGKIAQSLPSHHTEVLSSSDTLRSPILLSRSESSAAHHRPLAWPSPPAAAELGGPIHSSPPPNHLLPDNLVNLADAPPSETSSAQTSTQLASLSLSSSSFSSSIAMEFLTPFSHPISGPPEPDSLVPESPLTVNLLEATPFRARLLI